MLSAQGGVVVYRGEIKQGGQVVLALSPRGWLDYSILSPIPRLLAFRPVEQGWKRVFYRNPDAQLRR